jgi:hypothetical protein
MTQERISAQELLFIVAAIKQQQVQKEKELVELAAQPDATIIQFPKKI